MSVSESDVSMLRAKADAMGLTPLILTMLGNEEMQPQLEAMAAQFGVSLDEVREAFKDA